MSHYNGGYRQGGDLYRPGNSRNNKNYTPSHSNPGSHNRNSQFSRNDHQSSYRPNHSDRTHQHPGQNGRYQLKQFNNAYHQVYAQTQSENQLWQGDLDPTWTEQNLMDIWAQVGENPVSVKLIRDKMGKPQYCFVTFASQAAVASAIQKNRMRVPGSARSFKLNWASGGSHGDSRGGNRNSGNSPAARNSAEFSVFVGDLDHEVTEPTLYASFSKEFPGQVKQVKIMTDPITGASKGFGFVRFFSEEAQQSALHSMNGAIIGDRPIRVGAASGGNQDSASKHGKEQLAASVVIAQKQPPLTVFTDPNVTLISILGITTAITSDELKAHFLPFGNIVYCRINYAKHMAHIKYYLRGSAASALLFMHGFVINGCRLTLRWARDEIVSDGKVRFGPGDKNAKYVAAEKAPLLYGDIPNNVVFEDLTREEVSALNFVQEDDLTVQDLDDRMLLQKSNRDQYLELAF